MATNYYNRKEILASSFSPGDYQLTVGDWLSKRQAIFSNEGDVPTIAGHAISEVNEIIEEMEIGDNVTAQKMETLDYGWLIVGTMLANGIEVNNWDVMPHVNGVGKRSDIYDRLKEVAGNLTKRNLFSEGHRALGLWFSALAGQDVTDITADVARVVEKNQRNYSEYLFSGFDPRTGRLWQGDMKKLAFDIPRTHVRTLRDHLVKNEGLVDRKNGLHPSDWWPYYSLIMAFSWATSSEEALIMGGQTHFQLQKTLLQRGAVDLSEKRLVA